MCFQGFEKPHPSVPCGGSMRDGTGCGVCFACREEASLTGGNAPEVDSDPDGGGGEDLP